MAIPQLPIVNRSSPSLSGMPNEIKLGIFNILRDERLYDDIKSLSNVDRSFRQIGRQHRAAQLEYFNPNATFDRSMRRYSPVVPREGRLLHKYLGKMMVAPALASEVQELRLGLWRTDLTMYPEDSGDNVEVLGGKDYEMLSPTVIELTHYFENSARRDAILKFGTPGSVSLPRALTGQLLVDAIRGSQDALIIHLLLLTPNLKHLELPAHPLSLDILYVLEHSRLNPGNHVGDRLETLTIGHTQQGRGMYLDDIPVLLSLPNLKVLNVSKCLSINFPLNASIHPRFLDLQSPLKEMTLIGDFHYGCMDDILKMTPRIEVLHIEQVPSDDPESHGIGFPYYSVNRWNDSMTRRCPNLRKLVVINSPPPLMWSRHDPTRCARIPNLDRLTNLIELEVSADLFFNVFNNNPNPSPGPPPRTVPPNLERLTIHHVPPRRLVVELKPMMLLKRDPPHQILLLPNLRFLHLRLFDLPEAWDGRELKWLRRWKIGNPEVKVVLDHLALCDDPKSQNKRRHIETPETTTEYWGKVWRGVVPGMRR